MSFLSGDLAKIGTVRNGAITKLSQIMWMPERGGGRKNKELNIITIERVRRHDKRKRKQRRSDKVM